MLQEWRGVVIPGTRPASLQLLSVQDKLRNGWFPRHQFPTIMRASRTHVTSAILVMILLVHLIAANAARAQGDQGGDSNRRAFDAPRMEMSVSTQASGVGGASVQAGRLKAAGSLGATVGGAQDIGYARMLIERGEVPSSIGFSAEGLYSEHDIATPSNHCDESLCLSLGYGYVPLADSSKHALLVQLGMGSNIRADQFRRSPLRLAIVIDKSGSMSGAKIQAVRTALVKLIGQLNDEDRVTIIFFNEQARQVVALGSGGRTEELLRSVELLTASGGTNIEDGLLLGFQSIDALPDEPGTTKRLILMTDMQPTVGRTDSMSFRSLTERYALKGIGLSAFGVGIDFHHDLLYHISRLRGGNFFYLESPEKIARVFDTEFDYMVTPLLYDLNVSIKTPNGMRLTAVYGLPTWKPGETDAHLHIPTVFLSSNRGAIVLRYEKDGEGDLTIDNGDLLATGTLSYTDVTGVPHSSTTGVRHTGADRLVPGTRFFTHDGMRLAAGLTNVYLGLRDACAWMSRGEMERAIQALTRARALVMLDNLTLNDKGLDAESALLGRLEENIRAQRPTPAP